MKKIIRSLFIIASVLYSVQAFSVGECIGTGCQGGGQYPSTTQTTSANTFTTVTTAAYAGEYAVYSVVSGRVYEWSTCSTDGGDATYDSYLSLLASDNTTLICASNDFCGNDAKIRWTSDRTGDVQVLLTQKGTTNCDVNTTFSTVVWRCVTCGAGSPANDECTAAINLSVNSGSTCALVTNGDVVNATNSGLADCAGNANNDVWYKFTATAASNHVVRVNVAGASDIDPVIEIRSGACNGVTVACADNGLSGDGEIISVIGLTNGSVYYVRVYDYATASPVTTAFDICVTTPSHCYPQYGSGTSSGDFIEDVTLDGVGLADISNLATGASATPYYKDYSATKSATLYQNTSYNLVLKSGTYASGGETYAAWIDYNGDGDFSDAGEKLGENTGVGASTNTTIAFTTSASATVGTTIMRVRNVWSSTSIDPCSNYSFGEAEDYAIVISECITAGAPASFSTSGITTSGATLNWAAGSPAGTATVTYYWAVSTTSGVTYESGYDQRGTATSLLQAIGGLTVGQTYYWNVKAVVACNGTESSYGTESSFTVNCTTPGAPVIGTASGISTTSATLNWTANATPGSPTVTYYWAVGTANTVTYEAGYTDRGTTTSLNAITYGLSATTSYYYRVKAVTSCDGSVSSYSAVSTVFATTGVPNPLVTWTGNGATTGNEWADANNWIASGCSCAQVPTIGDNVQIPDVSLGSNNFPNISSGGLSVGNTLRTNLCKTLTIDAGSKLSLTTTFSVSVTASMDVFGEFNQNAGSNSDRFVIGSGGGVTVKNGGYLNIGSTAISAGLPGGTVNQYNDVLINSNGALNINPGGKVFIMDNLVLKGDLSMTGGELWIKYYGSGSATTPSFDMWGTSNTSVSGGNIYICGATNGARMIDWNPAPASFSVTGGTINLLNEQSIGTLNYAGLVDFAGHTINNLLINRTPTTSMDLTNVIVAGDITCSNGLFDGNSLAVTLIGSSNIVGGTGQISFDGLTLNSGANYTFSPSGAINDVNIGNNGGNFTLNSNATLTIASGKYIDIYSLGTSTFNGNIISAAQYNGVREIDLNNTGILTGTGVIDADLRIFDDITTLSGNFTLNGDFIIYNGGTTASQGSLVMGANTLTIDGSWTNNFSFTRGTGLVVFTGSGKFINGSVATLFNDLTINSGASYTFSSTNLNMDAYGSFLLNGTLNVNSGNWLNLRAATATLDGIQINGSLIAAGAYDGTRDVNTWNNVVMTIGGNLNADLRVYTGNTTLSGDATINGDLEMRATAGTLTMGSNTLTLGGDFTNNYRFVRGTGTVKFAGTVSRTIFTGCTDTSTDDCTAGTEATYNRFNNLIIEQTAGMEVALLNGSSNLRVDGDLTVKTGILNSGSATYGQKIYVAGGAVVETGAKINVGLSVQNSGEVLDLRGDLTVRGQITTNRALIDGYAEVRTFASKLYGTGTANEINTDVQVFLSSATEQITDLYISGDLIIQTTNNFQCNDPSLSLTIGGNLYIYNNFTHKGIVNLYGNFRESNFVGGNANTTTINESTFNMYNSKFINFNPSSGFGDLNIKTGIRSINEYGDDNKVGEISSYTSLDINGDLTIENGATLRMDDDGAFEDDDGVAATDKNISLAKNLTTIGTGVFDEGTGTVFFDGASGDQFVNFADPLTNTLYRVDVNKVADKVVLSTNMNILNTLDLNTGLNLNRKNLDVGTSTVNSYMSGGLLGYVVSEDFLNLGIFTQTVGTSVVTMNYPFATIAGNQLPLTFRHETTGNIGKVSVSTYPTGANNLPMPTGVTSINNDANTENSANMVDRYFDFTIGTPANLNAATVEFPYDAAEQDAGWSVANEGELVSQHWNSTSSTWDPIPSGTSTVNTTTDIVTTTGITSFSPFALVRSSSPLTIKVLPIELLVFDAIAKNNKTVDVIWVTQTEIDNDYFIIQKSLDLIEIKKVGRVEGAGNSEQQISYHITDETPYTGVSYYRLKQVDYDGTFTYSEWKAVYIKPAADAKYDDEKEAAIAKNNIYLIKAYPNPTLNDVTVVYACKNAQKVEFTLMDISGRMLLNQHISAGEGDNVLRFDLGSFRPGSYIIILEGEQGVAQTKIIKN